MANNTSVPEVKSKVVEFSELDGLIKFILAVFLAVMPFYFQKPSSYVILFLYLLLLTLYSDIKLQTLIYSASSYFIIVILPYVFGLLINWIITTFTGISLPASYLEAGMLIRLVRLLIIWYVCIFYFHTTSIKTVLGLIDKLCTPLKLVGVPVADYLKVVMCIVLELKQTGAEAKKNLAATMRVLLDGDGQRRFKLNIKGISQNIVSLIVSSFAKLDRIESFVKQAKAEDLYYYKLRLTKKEFVLALSFILFVAMIRISEQGYW